MTYRPRHYRLLPDHSVEPVDTSLAGFDEAALLAWAKEVWGDDDGRRVGFTEIAPGIEVSTVFLGIDHNHWSGPPLLFETMIFDDYGGQETYRYSTWDEAVEGHRLAVEAVKSRLHFAPEPEPNGK